MTKIQPLPKTVIDSINSFVSTQKFLDTNTLIRDFIFSILENYCTVLYYPQENDDNDGCHIKRVVNNELCNFVYINTHKSIEKQVFTAAHELGHILDLNSYLKNNCSEYNEKYEENAVNQFAAILLMPEDVFCKEVKNHYKEYCDTENTITLDGLIKFCLYLMDYFFVPFKSVVIRLYEVNFLKKEEAQPIINNEVILAKINDYIKTLGYKRLGIRSEKKNIKDFSEIIDKAEKAEKFSKTKLDSLRTKMDIPIIDSDSLSKSIKLSSPKSE